MTTEAARAPANDGLFPKAFAWTDRHGIAWFGILMAATLPSLLMLWRYTTGTGFTVFTWLVNLTVVTVAIPYLFSACAQLAYLVSRRRRVAFTAVAARPAGWDTSGHAGVAAALEATAFPQLGPTGRAAALGAAPAVGLTRVYVGAHLPLGVVGGAALGLAVEAALAIAGDHRPGLSPSVSAACPDAPSRAECHTR